MSPIRLLVVDDHALFRLGLVSLLSEMDDFQVVGEAGDGESALSTLPQLRPDVMLLDVNMPGMGGVETVRQVRALRPADQCRILMLTISKSETDLFGAINAGADGYILKNAEPEELRQAIIQVSKGLSVLSPYVTRQVMQAASNGQSSSPDPLLSHREMEVLSCLAQGKTTIQIADSLYISENTVKTHVRHILEKLAASNRAEAVSKAIQAGLIKG